MIRISESPFVRDPRPTLAANLGDPPIVAAAQLAEVPVLVSSSYIDSLSELSRVLDSALRSIVERYFVDKRIRQIYCLSEPLEAILQLARGQPYQVGLYRPDFVYDVDGQPRICEIGARYPLNGWVLSSLVAAAAQERHVARGVRCQAQQLGLVDDLFILEPPGERVAIVHANEPGTEVHLFAKALRRRGFETLDVHPSELRVRSGRLSVNKKAIDRCILELDRSELRLIPRDALRCLIDGHAYFNDVRTLILVHDKRVLAVLCSEEIMRDCISAKEHSTLKPFLIPSWTAHDARTRTTLLRRSENMIAKRSSGGRGIDALVRSSCNESRWRERIELESSSDMYQDYLSQRVFTLPMDGRNLHLVGMHLCHNHRSYGAGVFRGSEETIINVHGNRGRLFPALVEQ